MYLSIYLSMYVLAIVATPFNLQLWNFGTTLLTGPPKKGFLKFLKNCFFAELSPFFYISLRFICNFEEQLRKKQKQKNKNKKTNFDSARACEIWTVNRIFKTSNDKSSTVHITLCTFDFLLIIHCGGKHSPTTDVINSTKWRVRHK